jgi:polyribonucleotide 5'-hydroxyl-kinase
MSANQRRQDWSLHKECELRCEVSENDVLTLKLTAGTAEIFGVEMALNRDYSFRDQNIAVFTWYGCTIESVLESATADKSTIYVENTTPMIAYANTHIQLEARRDVALSNSGPGPRVLICGPLDQGKSSLAQILTAYAIRLDRTPIFVDLDVSQSFISIPGTMGAIPLDKNNLNVEVSFNL